MPRKRFTVRDATRIGRILDVEYYGFTPADLARGMNVELEHGTVDPRTNVTDDDPILTAKIALAHLYECAAYYVCEDAREAACKASQRALKRRR